MERAGGEGDDQRGALETSSGHRVETGPLKLRARRAWEVDSNSKGDLGGGYSLMDFVVSWMMFHTSVFKGCFWRIKLEAALFMHVPIWARNGIWSPRGWGPGGCGPDCNQSPWCVGPSTPPLPKSPYLAQWPGALGEPSEVWEGLRLASTCAVGPGIEPEQLWKELPEWWVSEQSLPVSLSASWTDFPMAEWPMSQHVYHSPPCLTGPDSTLLYSGLVLTVSLAGLLTLFKNKFTDTGRAVGKGDQDREWMLKGKMLW